ncbi:hypothetical protein Pint_22590 [Pistacia integerrima]|uniref:Uncharacterized protein n=1 Tax=Pistacia integerrima TaxID=434235 RepID=A0ACC0YGS2_9ROSI|nr:hypothetical protein Pint_22590 [Pistacia integerrima]
MNWIGLDWINKLVPPFGSLRFVYSRTSLPAIFSLHS